MLLVCGRWAGSCSAAHDYLVLRRLLRVDGVDWLLLKHRSIARGIVWRKDACRQINSDRELVITDMEKRGRKSTFRQAVSALWRTHTVFYSYTERTEVFYTYTTNPDRNLQFMSPTSIRTHASLKWKWNTFVLKSQNLNTGTHRLSANMCIYGNNHKYLCYSKPEFWKM